MYNIAKSNAFQKFVGAAEFDHTIFLQDKKVGFWYDSNNWN
jgi:hypothetical protein